MVKIRNVILCAYRDSIMGYEAGLCWYFVLSSDMGACVALCWRTIKNMISTVNMFLGQNTSCFQYLMESLEPYFIHYTGCFMTVSCSCSVVKVYSNSSCFKDA